MGCKLLKIMANGLYAVFHGFGGWLLGLLGWRWRCPKFFFDAYARLCQLSQHRAVTVGCPSNGRCASSISDLPAPAAQTSAGGTACSLLPWPAVLPPGHPSIHPHLLLFSGDVSLTPQPTSQCSYSPHRGHPLRLLRRLRVVLFVGLALVHRVCALGAARSTCSTNNSHRKRLTVGVNTRKCLLITRKIMIPPPDSKDPPDGPPYLAKKHFPLTTGTHQLHLRTQGSASLLRTKKWIRPASWDPL